MLNRHACIFVEIYDGVPEHTFLLGLFVHYDTFCERTILLHESFPLNKQWLTIKPLAEYTCRTFLQYNFA